MADVKARQRVTILGGGAGGLELAIGLSRRSDMDVTLVDRVSTHLWKPRLHEFAAGTVNSSLAEMSFYTLAGMHGFRFEQGDVETIDRTAKTVRLAEMRSATDQFITASRSLAYDCCVVALGGLTATFNTEGVAEHAIRLDEKSDAEEFRDLFIALMIHARVSREPAHVVIVGSGATGTELAAHLRLSEQAFAHERGSDEMRPLLKLTILEAAPQLMPGADEGLRKSVSDRLDQLGIVVRTNAAVDLVSETEIRIKTGEAFPADVTVWAAGLTGHPLLKQLADFEMDKKGRIVVDDRLRSSIDPAITVIGDAASFTPEGAEAPLPPTAQCASQQADYLVSALPELLAGGTPKPFVYNDRGRLLSLGGAGSVGLVGFLRKNDFLVEGRFATAAYHGLQRRHQWSVLGPLRGSVAILADMMSPTSGPAMKLHG
nr:FAD-dependent oxidoreductase [Aurantimonas aggregata]